jgi:hypothetical protein
MRPTAAKVTQVTGSELLLIGLKNTPDTGRPNFKSFGGRDAAGGNLQPRIEGRVRCSLLVLQSCGHELVALFPLDTLGGVGRFPSQSESEPRHS